MIKRVIHTAITLAVLLVSCRQDDLLDSMPTAHEGYVALRFSADIPAMQEVVTRSVDPDGGGVQDMTLFCFDSYVFLPRPSRPKLPLPGMEPA